MSVDGYHWSTDIFANANIVLEARDGIDQKSGSSASLLMGALPVDRFGAFESKFYSAMTRSLPLPVFMHPENLDRILAGGRRS